MSFGTEEVHTSCPYCGEPISIVVETLYGTQEYIEDCEVCCRPIRFRVVASGEDEEPSVSVRREGE